MKFISILILIFAFKANAQTATVKDIPTDGEETTISVSKGSRAQAQFEITEGTAQVEGDPEILVNAARSSWKKSCEDWKKEIKDLNKQNQVLAISCNASTCAKNEGSSTVCQSTGTYKLKVQIR